jgi:hypothetical protein
MLEGCAHGSSIRMLRYAATQESRHGKARQRAARSQAESSRVRASEEGVAVHGRGGVVGSITFLGRDSRLAVGPLQLGIRDLR